MAKIKNRARLRAKLMALSPEIKAGIQAPLKKSAQDIVDLAIHLCPRKTGALANSIDWNVGEPPASARMGSAGTKTFSGDSSDGGDDPDAIKVSVYAGNDRAFYARWVEFGTQPSKKGRRVASGRKGSKTRLQYRTHPGTHPQPFFYPAYRAIKDQAYTAIARAVNSAITKVGGVGGSTDGD